MSPHRPSPIALNVFLVMFALSALLGVLPAYDPRLSAAALAVTLACVALYFLIAHGARTDRLVRAAASIGMLVATASALYFITQYGHLNYAKGGIIPRLGDATTVLPALGGFAPQLNAAAAFLEVAVPLGIALAVSSRSAPGRIAWGSATLVVLYAIFLTASRGSWLALGLTGALAAGIALLRRLPRRAAVGILVAGLVALALGLLVIVALGPDRIPVLASTFSRASDRGRLYLNSLNLAADTPFTGIGLGDTFAMIYSRYVLMIYVPFLTYAHNLPLSIWLNQGLLGLVALAGMVISFYAFVYRVQRVASASAVFHGAWLGVTATWLHGLTDAPQYADSRWVMPMLFVWLGLTVAAGRLAVRDLPPAGIQRPRRAVILIVAGASVAVLAVVAALSSPLRAAWHTNLGAIAEARAALDSQLTPAQRRAGFEAAIAEYRTALAIDPNWANANRRLGNLYVSVEEYPDGVPLLERAYAAEPTHPASVKGLGLAYTWVGRTAEAAEVFRRLDDPAEMERELYTWANFRLGQSEPLLAAYALEAAQAMYPDAPAVDTWLLIAEHYREANRPDLARLWYNRVLEADPANERARQALGELAP